MNDNFGHDAGDALLTELAEIYTDSVRKGADFPFRYGGDEFGVILGESLDTSALAVAERIRRRYENSAIGNSTLSIGVAGFLSQTGNIEKDIQSFFKAADNAVYQAKNKVICF